MRKILILCLLVFNVIPADLGANPPEPLSWKNHFVVSYLGIPVLDCYQDFNTKDSLITVVYDNQIKPFWAKFSDVHNIYAATFTGTDFSPRSDAKEVFEGKFLQSLAVTYDLPERQLIFDDGNRISWPEGYRSVFSAVHYLEGFARQLHYPLQLAILIEGARWRADIVDLGTTGISVTGEAVLTRHLRVTMQPAGQRSERLTKRTDVLMDFLTTPGSTLELWIDDTPQIVRAKVGEFPKAVVLELVKKDVMIHETD
ncbi:MAG: hypothetical protein K9N34_08150 [Candidatus Marinimicrobia bacterium]|nr:hypothetical protein [Candidatus Neomarinimicrobiota bacterium]MCF7839877.1 hypothetical protein [Candidatus Neomarinimicrobiota bacterium]MCF7902665.1 hypothetical protein [Candidatus Neomarinimicrobiota bacterium]